MTDRGDFWSLFLNEKTTMKVYVIVNIDREHNHSVVGVATTKDRAREMGEEYRKEPLSLDGNGGLNDYNASGYPDCVGHALECVLDGEIGE